MGEGVWNPLQRGRKGHPTMYMYMYHNYKMITNNVNIPFRHDSGSTDYKFCNQFMVVIHVQCRMPFMSPL